MGAKRDVAGEDGGDSDELGRSTVSFPPDIVAGTDMAPEL